MSFYTDFFTNNLFFVTQDSVGREPVLGNEMMMRLMQAALDWARERGAYERIGYLFLPEQIQLLLSPTATVALDRIMQRTRQRFQQEYHELLNMPGDTLLWQEEYRARRVHDVEELALYLDTMHMLPVQRGLVKEPGQWPYSSFVLWQGRGLYPPGWGVEQ
ncbi:MAG: hypothetical protein KDE53_09745 [Caldilineaceae bacterium]|nr:hypothetical protein [Caldilineaceae bacterium]MCB0125646.1 hypothetical protein [Caldilineaceae bacterium]